MSSEETSGGSLRTAVSSPEAVRALLAEHGYIAGEGLAVAISVAGQLDQPLLLEGAAGVGKTDVATALAAATEARLVRLQCYEGIDVHQAVYDWDYSRQLLAARMAEAGEPVESLFSRRFLVGRPLLEALEHAGRTILLVDEVDRADDEFEAFLLEILSEFQITIPELGTISSASEPPLVVLTSNRTRELHDALKRRCFFHWIDYPSRERELEIVAARVPEAPRDVAERVCEAVEQLRAKPLYKPPGIGETINWTRALLAVDSFDLDTVIGAALKVQEDIEEVRRDGLLDGL